MISRGVNAPRARGVGRWFDAAGAIGLGRRRATYEGQAAIDWNNAATTASGARGGRYGFEISRPGAHLELDLRGLIRDLTKDTIAHRPVGEISAAFHGTLSEATAAMVRQIAQLDGRRPVILTGGCFQNARLAETIHGLLTPEFDVFLHRDVPCGDGGIALGQAAIAAAN
jgi:hydrogenase maturation protein HypF